MATNGYKASYDKTYDTENIENVNSGDYREPAKATFGQKVKNHYKRFWWVHLIILVAGVLLVTLLLLYVAMPHIAQNAINDSTITLISQTAWAPTPEQINLHMVTINNQTSPFHPRIDGFNASLFIENTEPNIIPFGYIQIPEFKALSSTTITIDQVFKIANMDQFIAYNKLQLLSDEYRVAFRGRTAIHEGSMPAAHVDFNKVVTAKGLNGLKGFKVQNFNITLTPDADGQNLHGTVYIPNQSSLTVSMGKVMMNLFVDGEIIGNSTIQDLTLKPGDNLLPMTSASDQVKVVNLITSKYKNGILPVTIIGNSSVYNGQHLVYFEQALASNPLTANLDIGSALKSIGLNIVNNTSSSSTSTSTSSSAAGFGFPTSSSSSSAAFFGFPTSSSSSSQAAFFGFATSTSSSSGGFGFATTTSSP